MIKHRITFYNILIICLSVIGSSILYTNNSLFGKIFGVLLIVYSLVYFFGSVLSYIKLENEDLAIHLFPFGTMHNFPKNIDLINLNEDTFVLPRGPITIYQHQISYYDKVRKLDVKYPVFFFSKEEILKFLELAKQINPNLKTKYFTRFGASNEVKEVEKL